ncbi:amino acid transporter [Nonomuraea sp. SMC257]|uniref:Amino acid transporter n=1 Tax=Nonomuraea montanisoli TaxID=2741721 RepID=A0A7Y6IGH7_9ACTN|nr:amino acid transporter [Nonomuraea montanisoli]
MVRIETPYGPWEPAPLHEVVTLLRGSAAPWWVAGGYAVELAVGRAYREHGDVDIALLRRDQLAVRRLLDGWDVRVAGMDASFPPWPVDEVLPVEAHDIWVREHPDGPWRFQLMLDEADGDEWVFRRDPRVRRPLAGLTVEEDGFHRLTPEVQLLYKARGLRPKDEADFEAVLPVLTAAQRRWLDEALGIEHPAHPWRERLRG